MEVPRRIGHLTARVPLLPRRLLRVLVYELIVARDRKLRVAVRLGGTPLASDSSALCEPSGPGVVAPNVLLQCVTMLEFLQHAECPSGRPASGIDRIRVLDGPNKALEGWVATSQVWRPLPLP